MNYKEITSGYKVEMANRKAKGRNTSRKSRRNQRSRKVTRRNKTRSNRRNRSNRRKGLAYRNNKQRGGSYMESLSRPFFASVYPNALQSAYSTWTGATPNNYPANSQADVPAWKYEGNGIGQSLNPAMITPINSGFTLMASSSPYDASPLTTNGAGVSAGTATVSGGTGVAMAQASGPASSIADSMQAGRQSLRSY